MKTITFDETKWKLVPVGEPTREMVEAGERVRAGFSGLPPTLYFVWPAMVSVSPEPPAAESKAEQRMSALYKVVSDVVASDDCAINITRLHDYLGGEDIPASAVVCEAEPDERAFNAGRDSVERPPAAERVPLSAKQIQDEYYRLDAQETERFLFRRRVFEAGVRFAEAALGIKEQS